MKNIIFFLLSLMFTIMCTGCPVLCAPDNEIATLPDVSLTISPEKDAYSANEEMLLTFSHIPDFSFFKNYSFAIELKEFDENNKVYIATDKLKESNPESDSLAFGYEEADVKNSQKIVKTFTIKALEQGKFAYHIHGDGYHFYDNGGYTVVSYEKWLYIDVVE